LQRHAVPAPEAMAVFFKDPIDIEARGPDTAEAIRQP
jgi:hypothetical protein